MFERLTVFLVQSLSPSLPSPPLSFSPSFLSGFLILSSLCQLVPLSTFLIPSSFCLRMSCYNIVCFYLFFSLLPFSSKLVVSSYLWVFFFPLCLSRIVLSSFLLAFLSTFTFCSCADRAHSCTKHPRYSAGSHTLLSPSTVAQLVRAAANDIRPFAKITLTDAQNTRTAARDIHSAGYIFLLRKRAFA